MIARSLATISLLIVTLSASLAVAQTTPPPAAPPPAETMPPPATTPPPAETAAMPPPASPPPAAAMPPPPPATVSAGAAPSLKGFSAWGILPWGGVGVGARFMLPLGIAPLLQHPTIRDGFALEFGADYLHWNYGISVYNYSWNAVLPAAGFMWNVWINDSLILYPKAELGYYLGWYTGWNDTYGAQPTYGGLFWDVAVGAMYKLPGSITLRAEAGYAGLKLGAGLLF